MPRVSRVAKAKSHTKIIDVASQLFREKGIEATGLADVMKEVGMTHGGFYRHFASKEALVVAAIERGFEENLTRLPPELVSGKKIEAVRTFIAQYLSDQHIESPGQGCPIVALAGESLGRSSAERQAIADGIDNLTERLALLLGGEPDEAREKSAAILSILVGTVTLLRAAPSQNIRSAIRASSHAALDDYIGSTG